MKVVEAQLNECFGRLFLPFTVFWCTIGTILSCVILFRFHQGLILTILCGAIAFIAIVTQFLICRFPAKSSTLSHNALKNQLRIISASIGTIKQNSCQPFAIRVGAFCPLNTRTLIMIMFANIDLPLSVLLLYK